jgi:hypothetical protein
VVVEKNVSIPERFFDNHYVSNPVFISTIKKNVSIPERFFDNHYVSNPVFISTINSLENRKEAYIISNMGPCKAISEGITILIPKFCMKIDENSFVI